MIYYLVRHVLSNIKCTKKMIKLFKRMSFPFEMKVSFQNNFFGDFEKNQENVPVVGPDF